MTCFCKFHHRQRSKLPQRARAGVGRTRAIPLTLRCDHHLPHASSILNEHSLQLSYWHQDPYRIDVILIPQGQNRLAATRRTTNATRELWKKPTNGDFGEARLALTNARKGSQSSNLHRTKSESAIKMLDVSAFPAMGPQTTLMRTNSFLSPPLAVGDSPSPETGQLASRSTSCSLRRSTMLLDG